MNGLVTIRNIQSIASDASIVTGSFMDRVVVQTQLLYIFRMGACSDREQLNASRSGPKSVVVQESGKDLPPPESQLKVNAQPSGSELRNSNASASSKLRAQPVPRPAPRKGPTKVEQGTMTDDTPQQFQEVVSSCINCAFSLRNDRISDERAMQMIRESSIVHPRLECSSGMPVVNVCISPKCTNNSLYCSTEECEACESRHSACPSIPFKALSKLISKRKEEYMTYLTKAEHVENQIIDSVIANREKTHQRFDLGHMPTKYLRIIEKVYVGGEDNGLNGQMTFDLVKELKSNREEALFHQERAVNEYADTLKGVFGNFGSARDELEKAYSTGKLKHIFPYNVSKIDKITRKVSQFLVKCLGYPEKVELVYRASQNNFESQKFHQKCGKRTNLLILVETEYGKVIGGYSPVAYASKKARYKADPTNKSFLFSLDLEEKFKLIDESKAIYSYMGNGPHFGGGDLLIGDKCDAETVSQCNFPCYYADEEGKYPNCQETWTALTGNPNGNNFKVVEYEAYQVTYP